jgi:dephospho-CoA kinase
MDKFNSAGDCVGKPPGKYDIGLTGNIATGKSVVRKMLEHLGAYTIDADALSHRAISKGAPGYQAVIEAFGNWILDTEGQIDRSKLGGLVFRDPQALENLESIVHPLVTEAISLLMKRAKQEIIVVEAIKLLESELRPLCNSIWVTYAPEKIQVDRLMRKRKINREAALDRIHAQGAQDEKIEHANIVIRNTGSYEDLWAQVSAAWNNISSKTETLPAASKTSKAGEYSLQRGRPRDSKVIAETISRLSKNGQKVKDTDVMEAFGEKAFLLLHVDEQLVGLAGWQVENLVARTTDLYLEPEHRVAKALELLIAEVERASLDLQCEASLVFPTTDWADQENTWKAMGYEQRTPESLGVQAWQDAAVESKPPGTILMFKQLRSDRVLRPI